ncbi:MAG: DMT family transporter [Deltaproteobacteria bacterium]|nr:DMT family transporter [Deltaproteobacteria bacterium]
MRKPATSTFTVHLVLLAVQAAFASLSVEGKVAMGPVFQVDPTALAMARIAGGATVFIALALFTSGGSVRSLADVGKLAGLSLLGIVLNQLLFLRGLRTTTPLSATVLVGTIPVFAAAASVLFGRERAGWKTVAGLALSVLGIAVLAKFHLPAGGDLLVLLNALSYGIYLALAQPIVQRLGALRSMAWVFGLGSLLLLPWGGSALVHDALRWSAGAWGLVAFIVIVPSVLAYLGNTWALARAAPSQVAVYIYLQPLLVAALARIQLGHPVQPRVAVAGLLILAGVTLVVVRRTQPRP